MDQNTFEILNSLEFFRHFPEHLMKELMQIASLKTYNDGDILLKQGQENSNLYFLFSGRVSVLVDGGLVAHLDTKGDLLGEMSVISKLPCAATIMANEPVQIIQLEAAKIHQLENINIDQLQHTLYRIYANILTEKLRLTNQKAKHFEDLSNSLERTKEKLQNINVELEKKVEERTLDLKERNDELRASYTDLENRNTELAASHSKLEELISSRDLTLLKMERLQKEHLEILKDAIVDLKKQPELENLSQLDTAEVKIKEVIEMIEPITSQLHTVRQLQKQKVLLAESVKKQQIVAKLALGSSGVEFKIASQFDEAQKLIDSNQFDIIFVDTQMIPLIDYAKKRQKRAQFVLITGDEISSYLPVLLGRSFVPNIVSRDIDDRSFTIKNIVTSVSKLASSNIFGLEKYLAWGVNIKEHTVLHSNQRSELISDMLNYFTELGIRKSNLGRCQIVAEELLMNAIYDAPRDKSTGKSIYNHLPRTEQVELKDEEQSQFKYASDGLFMAISVEDPFGGLTKGILLNYLDSCYGGRAGELNKEKGGAGRGLHQIIENSDLVVFNVTPNVKTEVICLFNVDPKQAGAKHPSFHFFES